MRADLHIHTYYSDGAYSPAQIAAMAKAAGLSLISMTDHDSLAGLEEKAQAARAQGLSYVPGWEVSAYQGDLKVHILGYGCRICTPYEQFLRARIAGAVERAKDIIAKANDYFGLDVTLAEAERFHQKKDAPLHTMHIVAAFAARLGCNKGDLYAAAFEPGKPCHSTLGRPAPRDAIDVIHASGGIASLAHPGRIKLENEGRFSLMDELVDAGLDGIECSHSDHTEEQMEQFAAYARLRGLLRTGGSDFHAEGRSRVVGQPPFTPAEELLAALRRCGSQ